MRTDGFTLSELVHAVAKADAKCDGCTVEIGITHDASAGQSEMFAIVRSGKGRTRPWATARMFTMQHLLMNYLRRLAR